MDQQQCCCGDTVKNKNQKLVQKEHMQMPSEKIIIIRKQEDHSQHILEKGDWIKLNKGKGKKETSDRQGYVFCTFSM